MLWWLSWAALLALLGWAGSIEARTSYLQSRFFTWFDSGIKYWPGPDASPSIRFPQSGPRDIRLGYAMLPAIIPSLQARQFQIVTQARWSPRLDWFVDNGGYAVYTPKLQAGLRLYDRNGVPLFAAAYPEHVYDNFNDVPPLIARTLTFIEDGDLLDPQNPLHNPAIAWGRFFLATGGRVAGKINHHWLRGGASTLATQIVKFSDSPGGRTGGGEEKLRQMMTAAAMAYMDGPDTMAARRRILVTYLNSTPLASSPGYGEIIGIPEALSVWYGTDPAEASQVLMQPDVTARQGMVYREVLSLILSGQRPAYYLVQNRPALESLTDAYLRELAKAGIISSALRDSALAVRLPFVTVVSPPLAPASFTGNKATDWLQTELLSMLGLSQLWSLDRYDLTAYSTIDEAAQQRVTDVLTHLGDPGYDQSQGLYGKLMLTSGNKPSLINWSFVLYERGANANYVRIHADSLKQPFDINSGVKLQLGSTAKLRTLITYLNVVAALHDKLAALPAPDLQNIAATGPDNLTRWAAGYLAASSDHGLQPMLDAAMQRKYSASPVTFFTGGGNNSFGNFQPWENTLNPTIEYAFENSINCTFVRLMHDVRDYYIAQNVDEKQLLSDPHNPARLAYLRRFVAQEGSSYLYRFYTGYRGLTAAEAMERLAGHTAPQASHLADIFLAIHPNAGLVDMTAFLQAHMPKQSFAQLTEDRLSQLYVEFAGGRLSLNDEAYIASVHPLEIWLVIYLQTHPGAAWNDVSAASPDAIQQSYAWLFRPDKTFQQNVRIATLLEQDAFKGIWQDWRRQGYPFDRLVPSLGTAIGASGDKPDALAELMGVILTGGMQLPSVDFDRLEFADGTPYQTDLTSQPKPQRVMDPAVAQTVRQALLGVVRNGTASIVAGVYRAPDGSAMQIGGKTGSGDNRYHIYGPGGWLRGERVVDRTATFVFFLGDRFFGTVTAYVPGPPAAGFSFDSALSVQLLRDLQPQLAPLLQQQTEAAR